MRGQSSAGSKGGGGPSGPCEWVVQQKAQLRAIKLSWKQHGMKLSKWWSSVDKDARLKFLLVSHELVSIQQLYPSTSSTCMLKLPLESCPLVTKSNLLQHTLWDCSMKNWAIHRIAVNAHKRFRAIQEILPSYILSHHSCC